MAQNDEQPIRLPNILLYPRVEVEQRTHSGDEIGDNRAYVMSAHFGKKRYHEKQGVGSIWHDISRALFSLRAFSKNKSGTSLFIANS